jgi:ABC-type amino acid transport substrate-binding protein
MQRLINFFIIISVCAAFQLQAKETETIKVAKEPRKLYERDHYLYELLDKALIAAGATYDYEHVTVHPHQQRTLMALSSGKVDLHWSMTSPDREQIAIAIPVPLFKGYIGKRAIMVKKERLAQFAELNSIEQLKAFTAVQGHDWPDTKILAFHNLPIKPLSNYQAMFKLLAAGRVDYFPRSFIEVNSELEENPDKFVLLPNVYLEYPTAFYFFVNKAKPQLAGDLKRGLNKLKKTGEFDALFSRYFDKDLARLSMYQPDKAIRLKNPYFNAE